MKLINILPLFFLFWMNYSFAMSSITIQIKDNKIQYTDAKKYGSYYRVTKGMQPLTTPVYRWYSGGLKRAFTDKVMLRSRSDASIKFDISDSFSLKGVSFKLTNGTDFSKTKGDVTEVSKCSEQSQSATYDDMVGDSCVASEGHKLNSGSSQRFTDGFTPIVQIDNDSLIQKFKDANAPSGKYIAQIRFDAEYFMAVDPYSFVSNQTASGGLNVYINYEKAIDFSVNVDGDGIMESSHIYGGRIGGRTNFKIHINGEFNSVSAKLEHIGNFNLVSTSYPSERIPYNIDCISITKGACGASSSHWVIDGEKKISEGGITLDGDNDLSFALGLSYSTASDKLKTSGDYSDQFNIIFSPNL
ncbi:hypothetical protein [Photobacterium damselae]|uniref:Uncharacterized protein n=2 Tax=Photobacterium damselae TaxID=38293 RepID=A0ABD6X7N5_PHODM|nr:hypothetical protein [Photobacterium damselae]PSU18721.1 hypothetical protein CTM90_01690 [Photobacterium damselae]